MNWILQNAEIIGTVTAIICVVLIIRQNSLNFPIGIIKDILFLIVYVQIGLYASSFSQVILIGLSFYGWYKWLYGGQNQTELKVSRLSLKEALICGSVWVLGSLGFAVSVKMLAEQSGFAQPAYIYWDSSITVAIFLAYWMMARKKIENWFVWLIFVNIQYLFLSLAKDLYFFAALQPVYIILSFLGFSLWYKDLKKIRTPNEEFAAV